MFIICAVVAVLISLLPSKKPTTLSSDNILRSAAEQVLGHKIEDETFQKLKKKYEAGELK